MKNNILITMGILVLLGVAVQGLFGIVAGVFLSAILGIIYGAVKKNKQFLRWSVIALTIDIICIIPFYVGLIVQWTVSVGLSYLFSIHLGWGLVGMWCAFLLDENIRAFIFVKRWNSLKWAKKGFVK